MVEHGTVLQESSFVGSVSRVLCNEGTVMTVSDTAECLPDGTWSGQTPRCKSKQNHKK